MTIPIYSDKTSVGGNVNSTLKKATSQLVVKTSDISEIKPINKDLNKTEHSIQISNEAKILNNYIKITPSEVVDWDKVNEIKNQLESGSYSINSMKIAEKIIDFESKI